MRLLGLRLLALAALVALWLAASRLVGGGLVPGPPATARALYALAASGRLWPALADTLAVYLAGFALAAALGVPLGLALGGFRTLGRALDPYVNALAATPRVAFVPLIVVLLGLGAKAKIAIVVLGAVVPVLLNTAAGVLAADPDLVEMARSAGATRLQLFRHILLPGAVSYVLTGLRLGAALGLISTVVAELYTAVHGLGGLLAEYGNTFQMAPYFAVLLVLTGLGVAVTQGLRALETRLGRWRSAAR